MVIRFGKVEMLIHFIYTFEGSYEHTPLYICDNVEIYKPTNHQDTQTGYMLVVKKIIKKGMAVIRWNAI